VGIGDVLEIVALDEHARVFRRRDALAVIEGRRVGVVIVENVHRIAEADPRCPDDL
jgi:hypothetical protein